MLQKELDARDVQDPLFIMVKDVDDNVFYVQPGTMEILRERPMTAPCRGGILCEELGVFAKQFQFTIYISFFVKERGKL